MGLRVNVLSYKKTKKVVMVAKCKIYLAHMSLRGRGWVRFECICSVNYVSTIVLILIIIDGIYNLEYKLCCFVGHVCF